MASGLFFFYLIFFFINFFFAFLVCSKPIFTSFFVKVEEWRKKYEKARDDLDLLQNLAEEEKKK